MIRRLGILFVFVVLAATSTAVSAATVVRGPYQQSGTRDAITLRWRTDVPVPSEVRYGDDWTDLVHSVSDPTPRTEHELRIEGLTPDTRSWYALSDGATVLTGADPDTWWHTAPAPPASRSLRIWVLGDSGLAGYRQDAVRDAYLSVTADRPTDLVLLLGDNAYPDGTDVQYGYGLFQPYASVLRHAGLWPTRGNHDVIYPGENDDYFDFFTLPTAGESGGVPSGTESWYSFDVGNVHFLCFDSFQGDLSPPSAMLDWIAADLAANGLRWTIAYTHYSPYTKGSHDSDEQWASIQLREHFVPVLEQGGVDLLLTGHSHGYERSWPMDGHYGDSTTFADSLRLDDGDGDPLGDGPYLKPGPGPVPHSGTVYVVAGSASRTNGGIYDHPAMLRGEETLGSVVLDVDGDRLDARFITSTGAVHDRFAIVKPDPTAAPGPRPGSTVRVQPNPAPGASHFRFELARAGRWRIEVFDLAGRRVRVLTGEAGEGPVGAGFDGRDRDGRALASGTYLYRLTAPGVRHAGRLSIVR